MARPNNLELIRLGLVPQKGIIVILSSGPSVWIASKARGLDAI